MQLTGKALGTSKSDYKQQRTQSYICKYQVIAIINEFFNILCRNLPLQILKIEYFSIKQFSLSLKIKNN